ncbi:prepilin-type N-terminal cleavage/methylation domain [endosymbiont of Ridgeia piscesae]|uniref:Type II secretion system protein H n=2 Tax=endosymbiont of Ridgeia piscesae TaxID=54398 RepID=A0A0T5ZAD8_9GAMM|nr:prepilin-type N-terminal cleavage/methylation domain [endosymbiont of Ridgeia piscesae]KRT59787.1 prepilin-type N-terminal cleavage/methylation domain-containing protein [endosymbiont of Ridgeia piscesae]
MVLRFFARGKTDTLFILHPRRVCVQLPSGVFGVDDIVGFITFRRTVVPFVGQMGQLIGTATPAFVRFAIQMHKMKSTQGFTLIEVMTALVVGLIMLLVGIPAYNALMASNQVTAHVNDFAGAIQLARSEAVKRGGAVTICPQAANGSCSGAWADGWMVFPDRDGAGVRDMNDRAEDPVRVWQVAAGDVTPTFTNMPAYIRFLASGELDTTNAAGGMTFSFEFPHCEGNQVRQFAISTTGQMTVTKTSCTSGS